MKKILATVAAGLLLLPTIALAQPKGGVELTSTAEVEVVQKNEKNEDVIKRVLASTANVAPEDTVFLTVNYANKGDQPAADVVINNPIPEHMTYVTNSAEGADTNIDFSVDKGKTYGQLEKLIVKSGGKEKPASAADVTDVRWNIVKPIAPGSTGSVSFRAKVK